MHSTTLLATILSVAALVSAAPSTQGKPKADLSFMCNCSADMTAKDIQKQNAQIKKCCTSLGKQSSLNGGASIQFRQVNGTGLCDAFNARNATLQNSLEDRFQACCTADSNDFGPSCPNASSINGKQTQASINEWNRTCGQYKGCYIPSVSTSPNGLLLMGGIPFSGFNGGILYQDGKKFTGTQLGRQYKDGVEVKKGN